jgi:L-ascorbate metabolism protein UlaG (beta-lactamase superfamily)
MKNRVEIWYLYHSGFAVKIQNKLIIFDYYKNRANGNDLESGIFNPSFHRDEDVYVFVSHRHRDHFNPVIFEWEKHHPNIKYIISSDVDLLKVRNNMLIVQPDNSYNFYGLHVKTLPSTDEGVAFLVMTDDTILFHAGDLHWWYWHGEPDPWNPNMEKQYKKQIAKLKNVPIDIAFVPVDPRQGAYAAMGLEWFLREVKSSHIFPMHFGSDYTIMETINNLSAINNCQSKIHVISRRGQHYVIV